MDTRPEGPKCWDLTRDVPHNPVKGSFRFVVRARASKVLGLKGLSFLETGFPEFEETFNPTFNPTFIKYT